MRKTTENRQARKKRNGPGKFKERERAFDERMRGRNVKGRMRNRRWLIGRVLKGKYSHYLIDGLFGN